jgi:uncharacterized membrane protein YuzA (DUF378 family)
MLFWFVATSVLAISWVFRDPRFDHRWLILGALLPDLVDGLFGGARVLHSVVGAVGVLIGVMLVTIGRRSVRKRLIAVPIGILCHLVFDAAFATDHVFWWPFMGGFDDAPLPSVERGWWNLPLELVGIAGCWWIWRRARLADPERRRAFVTRGALDLP